MDPPAAVPTWVLLEGTSDVAAIRALRVARGVRPEDEPCVLVAMGGATNIRRTLDEVVSMAPRPRVVGLCDEREAPFFVRALEVHGAELELGVGVEVAAGAVPTLDTLPQWGFHVCRRDLEDELMRALGVDGTLRVLAGIGLRESFEAFTGQLAWRGRPVWDQLRRFGTTTAGRKELLAGALAAAVTVETTPPPLAALLDSMPVLREVSGPPA